MFSFGERLGMFFIVLGACFSAASVIPILLLAVSKWLRRTVKTWGGSSSSPDPIDNIIFLNLMVADLIRAIGNLLIVKWMLDGDVTEGPLCTFQAVIKQTGSTGMALMSLAIAVHTFCVLVLRWKGPQYISMLAVLVIWGFTALVIAISYNDHKHERYYGEAGHWCFVRQGFKKEQLITEYLWVWISAFLMAILYCIMFIIMRGWFVIDNGIYWYKTYGRKHGIVKPIEETQDEKDSKAIANLMLYYPAVFIVCIIPISVSRWIYFTESEVPYQVTLFGSTLFSLCGMFDAILFFLTRPELVVGTSDSDSPALLPAPATNTETGDVELAFTHSPASNYVDVERGRNSEFQPYNQMLNPEGTDSIRHTSSGGRMRSDLGSHDVDEDSEEYGHLPTL